MALKLVQEHNLILGPFRMSVAASVDGLAYMPDANGDLIVATGNVFAVYLANQCEVGDLVSGFVTGACVAKAGGAIACGAAAKYGSGGKIVAATVGTDQVVGYVWPIAALADNDMVTLIKIA